MERIPISSEQVFFDLPGWLDDPTLVDAIHGMIMAQQHIIGQPAPGNDAGKAHEMVCEQALEQILGSQKDVHGIATNREISNVISFNIPNDAHSISSEDILIRRARVDELLSRRLLETFEAPYPLEVRCSGHFWYPRGGYMGWHTNSASPGWRVYITHASEPGKSFFRYREPDTGRIVTALDSEWNVRAFRIDPGIPFWHTVYSETDRFSLGYVVRRRRWFKPITRGVRRLFGF
ncbi:hypothetical protein DFR30_2332 [Thiogranum longum]|uniref:2OG-Fe(II) oxygenase n=1 Tax=Thiogranum longum TaxID=1537524 RepID=A0A4R1HHZ4_9GAMM|nr:hypothetical protein [Thiogranum longum]TCK19039.1 hypothetical protein DFR30_2332 [Thiogranum longum]